MATRIQGTPPQTQPVTDLAPVEDLGLAPPPGKPPSTFEGMTPDAVLQLLESGSLNGQTDAQGASLRAQAVDAVLEHGAAYALQLSPEDMAHWESERREGPFKLYFAAALTAVLLLVVLLILFG